MVSCQWPEVVVIVIVVAAAGDLLLISFRLPLPLTPSLLTTANCPLSTNPPERQDASQDGRVRKMEAD